MFRLLVVFLAAFYCTLLIFGDENRRAEVARAQAEPLSLTLASLDLPDISDATPLTVFGLTEADAVQIALDAGAQLRDERGGPVLRGRMVQAPAAIAGADTQVVASNALVANYAVATTPLWYVTGSTVNLRSGPGTGNAVVGQATFGQPAEMVSEESGWYRIRMADGALDAWIFGKFLSETQPG